MEVMYEITDVENIETTLHVTMRIHEWRKLAGVLQGSNSPGWALAARISDMVKRAHEQYEAKDLELEEKE